MFFKLVLTKVFVSCNMPKQVRVGRSDLRNKFAKGVCVDKIGGEKSVCIGRVTGNKPFLLLDLTYNPITSF